MDFHTRSEFPVLVSDSLFEVVAEDKVLVDDPLHAGQIVLRQGGVVVDVHLVKLVFVGKVEVKCRRQIVSLLKGYNGKTTRMDRMNPSNMAHQRSLDPEGGSPPA